MTIERTPLDQAKDQIVVCRVVGHSWDDNPSANPDTEFSWWIALRCTRCTTERVDFLSIVGEVIGRQYFYPTGYKMEATRTRIPFRAELIRRGVLARTNKPISERAQARLKVVRGARRTG